MSSEFTTLLLRIPQDNQKKEDTAADFFAQLAEIVKGRHVTLSAEIAIYNKFLWFFIHCPKFVRDTIKGQWYSQYSHAEVEEIKDYTEKLITTYNNRVVMGCELYYEHSEFIPLKTYKELEKNPLVSLSGIANAFTNDEAGIIQLILESPPKDTPWEKFKKWYRKNSRKKSYQEGTVPEYTKLESEKEGKSYFKTTIRFIALGQNEAKVGINLSSMTAVYKKNLERSGMQKLKEFGHRSDEKFIKAFRMRAPGRKRKRLSPDEIATFFHLPYAEEGISQIVQVRSKKAPAPQDLPRGEASTKDLAVFGETNFQNEKVTFGIKVPERRRHTYIIGKSGMGKSKLLELLMHADVKAGHGFILLDPHGDLAKEVLNLIPDNRIKDVVYLNPADLDYPIGFNPMEGVGSFEYRQNIVAGFISIFKKLFGLNWNERFEHVLRYTTLALLEYPQASILGIPRMLTDNIFRQEVIRHVTDPLVKKFWTTEFSGWNEQFSSEAIVPIINKIGQFVANPMVRNIVGQSKTGFSLDDIMNNEKILIANFSKGSLGEENSALLGSMLITKIWEMALARTNISENSRKDTFLYVDEFQNFATSTFANILSEARKYKLNLTVAHQYMAQLPDEVRATIFGNVSNLISFRIGGEDAQILVKEFEPTFEVNDFLNLDIRNFFIKMSIEGKTAQPFSAQTINTPESTPKNLDKIIEASRAAWAKPRKQVEEEINKWERGKLVEQKSQVVNATPVIPEHKIEQPTPEEFFPEPII